MGAPNVGHSPTSPASPPRPSLYPPVPTAVYGPANTHPGPVQYGNVDPRYPPNYDTSITLSNGAPAPNSTSEPTVKPKQKRKKPALDAVAAAEGKVDTEAKPKRQKKPKDPNAPPPKKRVKKEDKEALMAPPSHSEHHSSMYPPATVGQPAQNAPSPTAIPRASTDQFRAPARPQSSGQRYDPVRGMSVDIPNDRPSSTSAYGPVGLKSPVRQSPSIASLVDPSPPSTHAPSPSNPPRSTPSAYTPTLNGVPTSSATNPISSTPTPKITDLKDTLHPLKQVESPQRRPSPKAIKSREPATIAPPPLPGSALPPLTNGDLGKPSTKERKYEDVPNECIVVEVPIKRDNAGHHVNFLKEVEAKYGFDIAYPRIAEHRRRMKEIAAAGAALESVPGSADEMNLDVSEGESDLEMGGQGEGSNSDGTKRKRRINEKYDIDDEFIDDSEMIWQEQALASRDGYFVWSGPLIQEGDKPTIERADGTVKRGRGGGRGSGRGGSTRGDGTRTRGTRGGGPGSRGGTTVRKPRVTKADRARMESEKAEREKMGASAPKPELYPGTVG